MALIAAFTAWINVLDPLAATRSGIDKSFFLFGSAAEATYPPHPSVCSLLKRIGLV
jgi:hypothetical protein